MHEKLRLFLIGMVMGAAEVVPGVSGGTIAFVTGIYHRFLRALNRIEFSLFGRLKNEGPIAVWKWLDATFLVCLFSGMLVSIAAFAGSVSFMLQNYHVPTWSFFFGLILASVWLVTKQMQNLNWRHILIGGAGCAIALVITHIVPIEVQPTTVTIFIGGAIAVCAWILPGISGSYILLMLGLYQYVLEAIKGFDMLFLATLGAGCGIGLLSFAKVLSYLLDHFQQHTLALLTGFMLGSLVKIWPWQHVSSYQIMPDGSQIPLVQTPVSPFTYTGFTGNDADMAMALVGLMVGLLSVIGLQQLARDNNASTMV